MHKGVGREEPSFPGIRVGLIPFRTQGSKWEKKPFSPSFKMAQKVRRAPSQPRPLTSSRARTGALKRPPQSTKVALEVIGGGKKRKRATSNRIDLVFTDSSGSQDRLPQSVRARVFQVMNDQRKNSWPTATAWAAGLRHWLRATPTPPTSSSSAFATLCFTRFAHERADEERESACVRVAACARVRVEGKVRERSHAVALSRSVSCCQAA